MLLFRDVPWKTCRILPPARKSCADPIDRPLITGRQERARQGTLVLALIATVVLLDQAAKWWAWRHVPWARINAGGDVLVGHAVGGWYAGPATGALLDLLDFGLLSVVISALVRCRAAPIVTVPGALMIGGWASNLTDRLGFHYWTAPGSVRGVVDFIHLGVHYYNLADFFIIGCTPLFALGAVYLGTRAAVRLVTTGRRPAPARRRPRPRGRLRTRLRVPALASVSLGMVLVVAFGAANDAGVRAAARAPAHQPTYTDVFPSAYTYRG